MAPSLVPKKAGDRVKTNRRDAVIRLSTFVTPGAAQATLSASSRSAQERIVPLRITSLPLASTVTREASISAARRKASSILRRILGAERLQEVVDLKNAASFRRSDLRQVRLAGDDDDPYDFRNRGAFAFRPRPQLRREQTQNIFDVAVNLGDGRRPGIAPVMQPIPQSRSRLCRTNP